MDRPYTSELVRLVREWRSLILVVLLALLLLTMQQPTGSGLGRALFMAHLGLFMVWQPFVEGGQRLSAKALSTVALLIMLATIALDPRLLMIWIMVLAGIVGGKVPLSAERATRFFYLLALAFLVMLLLLLAVPGSFAQAALPAPLLALATIGLPVLLLVMAALPRGKDAAHVAEVVDFINSVFLFLLLAVVVLGSLSSMLLLKRDYAESILSTLIVLGCVLLFLGWVWNPHGGFAGLGDFLSRYVMSIGLPVERWLQVLANHVMTDEDPDTFVAGVVTDLGVDLPWVDGVRWTTRGAHGEQGDFIGYSREFVYQDISLVLFTRYPLSPSLNWHFNLLTQLLGEFYQDKARARHLKEISYLRAVHETGARLTHDVKNLLQSLHVLCVAADAAERGDSPASRALLSKQLPVITGRLGATLAKLQAPREEFDAATAPACAWWAEARARHAGQAWITFGPCDLPDDLTIPVALFTPALENLIGNLEKKRAQAGDLHAAISLGRKGSGAWLKVQDDGQAIESRLASQLTKSPVQSENGLGIGLFQIARLAENAGYRIALANNKPRSVCFLLEPA